MELKEYQQGVLSKLERYLTVLAEQREQAEDFVEFQKSKGKTATLGDYCRDAWDQLNAERLLPYLYQGGNAVVAPYLSRHDGLSNVRPGWCCGWCPPRPFTGKPGSNWPTASTLIGRCWSGLPVGG